MRYTRCVFVRDHIRTWLKKELNSRQEENLLIHGINSFKTHTIYYIDLRGFITVYMPTESGRAIDAGSKAAWMERTVIAHEIDLTKVL